MGEVQHGGCRGSASQALPWVPASSEPRTRNAERGSPQAPGTGAGCCSVPAPGCHSHSSSAASTPGKSLQQQQTWKRILSMTCCCPASPRFTSQSIRTHSPLSCFSLQRKLSKYSQTLLLNMPIIPLAAKAIPGKWSHPEYICTIWTNRFVTA